MCRVRKALTFKFGGLPCSQPCHLKVFISLMPSRTSCNGLRSCTESRLQNPVSMWILKSCVNLIGAENVKMVNASDSKIFAELWQNIKLCFLLLMSNRLNALNYTYPLFTWAEDHCPNLAERSALLPCTNGRAVDISSAVSLFEQYKQVRMINETLANKQAHCCRARSKSQSHLFLKPTANTLIEEMAFLIYEFFLV